MTAAVSATRLLGRLLGTAPLLEAPLVAADVTLAPLPRPAPDDLAIPVPPFISAGFTSTIELADVDGMHLALRDMFLGRPAAAPGPRPVRCHRHTRLARAGRWMAGCGYCRTAHGLSPAGAR